MFMLSFLTVVIMGIVTYAFWREGLLTACTMFINVLLAGLLTFMCFEPLADMLDPMFRDSPVTGWEDFLCLILLFSVFLGMLRGFTNHIAYTDLEYPPILLRAGCVIFGLLTGYLVSGFLIVAAQTMPLPNGATFAGFDPTIKAGEQGSRTSSAFPPDRVWLALMHRAGAKPFSFGEEGDTFDPNGNFQLRYHRYKQQNAQGNLTAHDKLLSVKPPIDD